MHNIEWSINKENGVHQDVVDVLIKSPWWKLKELWLNNAQLTAENENWEEEKIKTIKKNIKDIITRVSNNPKIRNEILHQTNMKQVLLLLCKNKTYENKIRELRGKDKKDNPEFKLCINNLAIYNGSYVPGNDSIIIDNLSLPGIVGITCKYKNFKEYFEFIHNELKSYNEDLMAAQQIFVDQENLKL